MCKKKRLIINQTPTTPTSAPRTAAARLVHQPVDPECDQRQHEEEDDDYYRYHVVFLDHFCGFFAYSLK